MSRLSESSDQPDRSSDELTIVIQVGAGDLEARVGLASGGPYDVDLSPMRLGLPGSELADTPGSRADTWVVRGLQ
jgi:hypothetical protein